MSERTKSREALIDALDRMTGGAWVFDCVEVVNALDDYLDARYGPPRATPDAESHGIARAVEMLEAEAKRAFNMDSPYLSAELERAADYLASLVRTDTPTETGDR